MITALVTVNIGLWDVIREPRADTLFSAFLIWSAVCFCTTMNARDSRAFLLYLTMGSICTVAACCTRQVGIFITAGYFLAMLIRWCQGQVSLIRLIASTTPGLFAILSVVILVVHDHHATNLDHSSLAGVTYTEQLRQPNVSLSAQLCDGVRRQTADVGRLLVPGMWGSFAHFGQWWNFNTIFYVALTGPVAIGWWNLTRRTADPLLWTVPFYAAMFIVWPFDQGTRFNVPMLPVLWASVWMLLRSWRHQRLQVMTILLCLHLLVSMGYLLRDFRIVAHWNQGLINMEQLARKVNTADTIATLGLAPNDFLLASMLWIDP